MKSARVLAALIVLGGVTSVRADFYDFEDVPLAYWSDNGGGQVDLGNYYSSVTFSAGVQAYNSSSAYPTHSGVLGLINNGGLNDDINFQIGFQANQVSFWYTTAIGFTATAYDSANNVVDTFTVGANTDTVNGTSDYGVLWSATGNIDHVSLSDGFPLSGYLTIDDLSVPDASSTLGLLGMAATGLVAFRRKFVA
jgi:hypothetical protein